VLQKTDITTLSANTYSDDQQAVTRRIQTTARGTSQTFEWRIKRKDGQLRWVEITLSPYIRGDVSYVLAEVTDITDYKHNDRRVSLLQRVLRHNLRNEVNVITGFADQLTDSTAVTSIAACADRINTSAQTLSQVAESMKQIESTITSDATARSRHRLATVVDDVAERLQSEYPTAAIEVTEATPLWANIDTAFKHAIRHALENGIEHADHEAPTVAVRIDNSPNTGRVEIRIDDDGPPIPPVELLALDDNRETTPTCHGSGCGLFVMKWCIESLGGELRIEPASDRGNSVYFYLPSKTPPDNNAN